MGRIVSRDPPAGNRKFAEFQNLVDSAGTLYTFRRMNRSLRALLFALFFTSGFCGLVYQVVWARLPPAARADLLEWLPASGLTSCVDLILRREHAVGIMLNSNPEIQITDDHPFNEYFLLRLMGLTWR
jgi:hypothetical protein